MAAIVYLGIKLGLMSLKAAGYSLDLALTGAAATFVAYLMFWPIVYVVAYIFHNSMVPPMAAAGCAG